VIAVPILAIATAVAVLWSVFKYQTTYAALIDSLPLQFRDGLSSKFAFPEYVLSPSTPLALQADYVRSQIGFCLATLGVSLLCLLNEKMLAGLIILFLFFGFTVLTMKSWKRYSENYNRRATQDKKGDDQGQC
jgi:hypothetical protein